MINFLSVAIQRLREYTAKRSFARNVSIMLMGTVAGQALSLLLSPVLTRLFTPEQFGYLGVYQSVLMTLAMVASLSLEQAIPICLVEVQCANLLALCVIILAGTTTLSSLLMWLLPAHTLEMLGLGSLSSYRYLVPIGLAWLGSYYILLAAATRAGAFEEIARTRVSQGVSGPLSQILLGWLGAGTPALVAGYIVGQASGTILLFSRVVLAQGGWLSHVSCRGISAVARRYVHFLTYVTLARVLDVAGGGMLLFVLFSACYSTKIAGFMFLSERMIVRPLIVMSTSLLQVYTGEAGRTVSEDPAQFRRRFYQVVPRQFLLATVWILVANAMADWAVPLAFGMAWVEAIPYLRALSLLYLLPVVLHPVSPTLQLLEHQITTVAWQFGRVICVVAGVLVPYQSGLSAVAALWVSAAIQATCCAILLALMAVLIEQRVERHRQLSP